VGGWHSLGKNGLQGQAIRNYEVARQSNINFSCEHINVPAWTWQIFPAPNEMTEAIGKAGF